MLARTGRTAATCTALLLVGTILLISLQRRPRPTTAGAPPPPEMLHLGGVIRDFRADHPDFDVADPTVMGHYAGNLHTALDVDGRPSFSGTGTEVLTQRFDIEGNPIPEYPVSGSDPGLPGGHFDVDVFDTPDSTKEIYHQHQFDDKFDVTYVDLVNDPNLLLDDVVGATYPNDLRVELLNNHHGGLGTYTFDAGAGLLVGPVEAGFTATFTPAALTQFRIDFNTLQDFQHTSPGTVQGDAIDRDDSLSIRIYDVTTDTLVYELAVYHHGDGDDLAADKICGDTILDTPGSEGTAGLGAVTDADSFGQWFRDVLGTNLSKAHRVALERNVYGVYEYLTSDFFPIDGSALGNDGDTHNSHFTYAISASFEYDECGGQFFEFQGNDDAWVFLDNQLVIDLGGGGHGRKQYMALDRLNLIDGQTYDLRFFYAHRRDAGGSTFNMRTNIVLTSQTPTVSGSYD